MTHEEEDMKRELGKLVERLKSGETNGEDVQCNEPVITCNNMSD